MTFNERNEKKLRKNYDNACWEGHCPNLKERENSGIRELTDRLAATSDKDVLTNVLEWEERNMVFWFERYPLPRVIAGLLGTSLFLCVLIINPLLVLIYPILFICLIALVSISAALLLVAIYMIHTYRKLPLRQFFNIFPWSLSIDSILRNRLCICRDYAKLTACLLFNMRPEKEIYFVHAPGHVATGIIIDNKPYILDQHLPVVTIDRWHKKWHKYGFSEKSVEMAKGNCLEPINLDRLLSGTNSSTVDTDRLANELKNRLNIQSLTKDAEFVSLEILHWKKGAILYEDDEIVNYSLARRLKILFYDEMLDASQVKDVRIEQKREDLIFRVDIEPKNRNKIIQVKNVP